MDDALVRTLATKAAQRMRENGFSPAVAVAVVFKEIYGGDGWNQEIRRAVLVEMGKRGGKKAGRTRKQHTAARAIRLAQMCREAEVLALQRRDHLVPDLY